MTYSRAMKKFQKLRLFLQKKSYILYTTIAFAIVFFSLFFIHPKLKTNTQNSSMRYKGVLQIWNIDTFEGGKGSRTSFLQNVAKTFEKKHQGVFVLVITHTVNSAKEALHRGERPDLLSYGTSCDFVADIARPIENMSYKAATMRGKCYAYPWAVGQYMLISFENNFENILPENTVLSSNKNALTVVAGVAMGLTGNFTLQESTTAYNNFVNKKFKYLLGTQRDVARLMSRNLSFYIQPITNFSNLQQYISITTADKGRIASCQSYIELLLSQEIQKKLSQIGMMSLQHNIYTAEHPLYTVEQNKPHWTISPFLDAEKLQQLITLAMEALKGDKNLAQNLQKFYILYL